MVHPSYSAEKDQRGIGSYELDHCNDDGQASEQHHLPFPEQVQEKSEFVQGAVIGKNDLPGIIPAVICFDRYEPSRVVRWT